MATHMSYFVLRRVTYAAVLFVIGIIIWWKRKRKYRDIWANEEDDEVDFDWQQGEDQDEADTDGQAHRDG